MADRVDKGIFESGGVERVAELSRLKLDRQELEQTGQQLERILEYFTRLAEVDTTDIEPACDPHDFTNQMREDIPSPGLEQDKITDLTDHNKDGFFTVPRTVE